MHRVMRQWLEAESHAYWAGLQPPCMHALGRATQQIQDGDDGQPAGAASASSVEGVRRGRSDIWPYPMARSASPAASAHVGKPLDPSSRAQADSGCWGGFAWAGPRFEASGAFRVTDWAVGSG